MAKRYDIIKGMKIAILGNGKEGQAVQKYFEKRGEYCEVFENFTDEELAKFDLSGFDEVFRSPSVKPLNKTWNSVTKYFFDNCKCPIIGVTGTKGKGTTCSLIYSVLSALGKKVWLVGNIGNPAIDVLDQISSDDVVVYEMSSFQLWDLQKSPYVSVVLPIEPDHLNIHKDYNEYVDSKANIARFQTTQDKCVFYDKNQDSVKIASTSEAQKFTYPLEKTEFLQKALDSLVIVGRHNQENAEAALLAVSAYFGDDLNSFLAKNFDAVCQGLHDFKGLPHRLEFLREINQVKYYDDNFATNVASTRVAIEAFPGQKIVIIIGGRDKTENEDLSELFELLQSEDIVKAVLMGESGHELARLYDSDKFVLVDNLMDAVVQAQKNAESIGADVVLMSPAAASFDMFQNVYDRGSQFAKIVNSIKSA